MSEKNEEIKVVAEVEESAQESVQESSQKSAPSAAKQKKAAKKNQQPGFFAKIGRFFARIGKFFARKFKEIRSELKKVTWPTFPTVLKQTGVVLTVVALFLVLVFVFDSLLSMAYTLLK